MKQIKWYIILLLSVFLNVWLCISIVKDKPVCERRHMDEIQSDNCISDEIMARRLADAVFRQDLLTMENQEYEVASDFDEIHNEWEYIYTMSDSESIVIRIRKDSGEISVFR